MEWTKMDRNLVAETYRELWPGEVTDLEMAMFCKALSWHKPEHVLDGMYLIFSNQENRLRPAAGRVRNMAAEAKRQDPNEAPTKIVEQPPHKVNADAVRGILKEYCKVINKNFQAVDGS